MGGLFAAVLAAALLSFASLTSAGPLALLSLACFFLMFIRNE